jgi:hypothetical protein
MDPVASSDQRVGLDRGREPRLGLGKLLHARLDRAGWLNSPCHKRNLLNRACREVGLDIAVGAPVPAAGDAGTYVHELGKRS